MILPFTSISSFILSYFGLLAVTLLIVKSVEVAISMIKREM